MLSILRTKITVQDNFPRYNYYYKLKGKVCQCALPSRIFVNKNIWGLINDNLQWNFLNNKTITEDLVI